MRNLIDKNRTLLYVISIVLTSSLLNIIGCVHVHVKNPEESKLEIIHDKTLKTKPGKQFVLSTSVGDVKINSWNRDEVNVKIYGNERAKRKIEFSFENNDKGIDIKTKGPGIKWFFGWSSSSPQLKYDVSVPERYNIKVETSGGDISVKNLTGNVRLETSGGDLNLNSINGNVDVTTSGGDVKIDDIYGRLEAKTSGGDIDVKKFNGEIKSSTSGGNISLNGTNGRVEASTSGGDINLDFTGQNYGISLKTTGGNIFVKLDPNFNAEVELSTLGGDVSCELPLTKVKKQKSSELQGTINTGGNSLICKTIGGDVTIRSR